MINRKMKKGLVTAGLVVSLVLTGCSYDASKSNNNSQQESLLEGTSLEKAFVANVTYERDVVSPAILKKENSNIYYDIVSGEYITDAGINLYEDVRSVSDIKFQSSIFEHLTEEDIKKLVNKEFTKEDEINLLIAIKANLAQITESSEKELIK